jgi:hypothetical protein
MGLAEGLVSIRFSIFHQLKSRFNYHQTPGRAHRIFALTRPSDAPPETLVYESFGNTSLLWNHDFVSHGVKNHRRLVNICKKCSLFRKSLDINKMHAC